MATATHDGAKHHHHILPIKVYLTVGAALLFLTIVTVVTAQFNFGPANIIVAMLIAGTKASLVVAYFMHLKYDNKIYTAVFVGSLMFLALFVMFTLLDTSRRADIYEIEGRPINPNTTMPATMPGGGTPAGHSGTNYPADTTMANPSKPVDTTLAPLVDSNKVDTTVKKPDSH